MRCPPAPSGGRRGRTKARQGQLNGSSREVGKVEGDGPEGPSSPPRSHRTCRFSASGASPWITPPSSIRRILAIRRARRTPKSHQLDLEAFASFAVNRFDTGGSDRNASAACCQTPGYRHPKLAASPRGLHGLAAAQSTQQAGWDRDSGDSRSKRAPLMFGESNRANGSNESGGFANPVTNRSWLR